MRDDWIGDYLLTLPVLASFDHPFASAQIEDTSQFTSNIACDAFTAEKFPGDYVGPWYHEADLLKTPLDLGPPAAKAPEGPGLGIELDEEQLEKYRDTTLKADAIG